MKHTVWTIVCMLCLFCAASPGFAYEEEKLPPLLQAAQDGDTNAVRVMLDYGAADIGRTGGDSDETALMRAAEGGHIELVRLLLDEGVSVHTSPPALNSAAINNYTDVVRLLLDHGADVNSQNDWGTPIMGAIRGGFSEAGLSERTDTIRLLLERGADIDARDGSGCTALMAAAEMGAIQTVRLLLESGADASLRDGEGRSALTYASDRDEYRTCAPDETYEAIVRMLIAARKAR